MVEFLLCLFVMCLVVFKLCSVRSVHVSMGVINFNLYSSRFDSCCCVLVLIEDNFQVEIVYGCDLKILHFEHSMACINDGIELVRVFFANCCW